MRSSQVGTPIAYDRTGGGPPVILVAGVLGARAFDPLPPAPQLASQLTVISYDRRGRGDSGDTPPYAVARAGSPAAGTSDVDVLGPVKSKP